MTHAEKHHRKYNYHHMETTRTSNDAQPLPPHCYRACITWFLLRPSWRSSANRCACNRKSFRRRTHWALFTQMPSKHLRQDIWLCEAFSMLFFLSWPSKHIKCTTYSTACNSNNNSETKVFGLSSENGFKCLVGLWSHCFCLQCSHVLCLLCCDPVHPVHGLRKWIIVHCKQQLQ